MIDPDIPSLSTDNNQNTNQVDPDISSLKIDNSQPQQQNPVYKPGTLNYALSQQNPYLKSGESGAIRYINNILNIAPSLLNSLGNFERPLIESTIGKQQAAQIPQIPSLTVPKALDVQNPNLIQNILNYGPEATQYAIGAYGLARAGLQIGAPALLSLSKKIMGASADETASNTIESLNPVPGSKSPIPDSGKQLALSINKNYSDNMKSIGDSMNSLLNDPKLQNNFLYKNSPYYSSDMVPKLLNNFDSEDNALGTINDIGDKFFSSSSQRLADNFKDNPDFNNANSLRIQLGKDWGALQRKNKINGLNDDETSKMNQLSSLRSQVENDMSNSMDKYDPSGSLSTQFDLLKNQWKDKVISYEKDPNIYRMATGEEDNPGNVASTFKDPRSSTMNVVNDLGPNALKTIQYHILKGNENGEDFNSAINKANDNGYSEYLTPYLRNANDLIKQQAARQNLTSNVGKGIGGALGWMASKFIPGAGPLTEMASSALGITAASKAMKAAQNAKNIPNNSYLSNIGKFKKANIAATANAPFNNNQPLDISINKYKGEQ